MRRLALLGLVSLSISLSACAMSAKGLKEGKVDASYTSAKPAKFVAACVANALNWQHSMFEESEDHWVITRSHNMYGIPTVRWDIFPSNGATAVELRSSLGMFQGVEKVKACL